MSSKNAKFDRYSVKSLLQETLLHTIEKIGTYLSDFLQNREPESLHQYRINVRTARSVCLEFSDFMDTKCQLALRKILKTLQQETNDMRDIDVFLADIEVYKTKVAPSCLQEFERLETKLKAEKEEAYNVFAAKYTQAFQKDIIAQLHAIQNDHWLCLPKSDKKIYTYVKEILFLRLEKITKRSKKLSLDSPNDRFHQLRLDYKKLRYNTDALKLDQISKCFKPLQTAFGKVQDINSQIARIKRYNTEHNRCLEQMIALLEHELIVDKQVCIEKSTKEKIRKMQNAIEKTFTCKDA